MCGGWLSQEVPLERWSSHLGGEGCNRNEKGNAIGQKADFKTDKKGGKRGHFRHGIIFIVKVLRWNQSKVY